MGCGWEKVTLGRTGLRVAPLGVSSSYGLGEKDVERAFERGLNYFYWGSFRRGTFGRGITNIARRSREDLVIVVQTYTRVGALMGASLEMALRRLKVEYTDVLLLGWWNEPVPERILEAAQKLVDKGKARHLMVSCHHRPTFRLHAEDPRIGALMVRYNAGHPGAEEDVFPHLPTKRPGIVAYTATRWGSLLRADLVGPDLRTPTASDCYRFALSNPNVDMCLIGPRDGAELDEAMRALERGPLSDEEMAWMRQVGKRARNSVKSATFSTVTG